MIKKSYKKIALVAIPLALIDQLTKWLAAVYIFEPIQLFPGVSFTYEENVGIAWSIAVQQELLLLINLILLILIPVVASKSIKLRFKISQIALGLIFGGAIGNIFDRVTRGYVIDFISVGWWPVFNLADTFLTVGVFLIIAFYGKIKLKKK